MEIWEIYVDVGLPLAIPKRDWAVLRIQARGASARSIAVMGPTAWSRFRTRLDAPSPAVRQNVARQIARTPVTLIIPRPRRLHAAKIGDRYIGQ